MGSWILGWLDNLRAIRRGNECIRISRTPFEGECGGSGGFANVALGNVVEGIRSLTEYRTKATANEFIYSTGGIDAPLVQWNWICGSGHCAP
jgi:hypothetical protein